jgi:predicted permease
MNRCLTLVTFAVAILAANLLIQRPSFARPAAVPLTVGAPMAATLKQIIAADGKWDDRFGTSVAISGDIAVIGAWLVDVGFFPDQGAAYIVERNAGGLGN